MVVQTTHEAVREHAYRNLDRPYPPLALAPNFESEASIAKKAADAKETPESTVPCDADQDNGGHARKHDVLDSYPVENKDVLPDLPKASADNEDIESWQSDYSSDTDISCRDIEAQEDFPDLEVEDMTDRDYMTFAFTEDPTGPRYYKLASSRKRKRSDSSSDDEDENNETSSE